MGAVAVRRTSVTATVVVVVDQPSQVGTPVPAAGPDRLLDRIEDERAVGSRQVAPRLGPLERGGAGSRQLKRDSALSHVLDVDLATLHRRLGERPDDEWGGGKPTERELIVRWHQAKEYLPENGIVIDASTPIEHVVDEILRRCQAST
jgi:hypothetical protein